MGSHPVVPLLLRATPRALYYQDLLEFDWPWGGEFGQDDPQSP